jgi:Rieske Fe-S protein
VLAIIAPILIFIYPPQGQSKTKDSTVKLDKSLDALGSDEAVKFQSPAETGFIMKDGGGDNAPGKVAFAGYAIKEAAGAIRVFAVNCSHLGCSVQFNADAKRFDCPCHGSQFAADGHVVHGPAVYPLSNLIWKRGPSPDQIILSAYELKGIG